jgi:uncharacterized membrane protein YcjF (UPF0283 family)
VTTVAGGRGSSEGLAVEDRLEPWTDALDPTLAALRRVGVHLGSIIVTLIRPLLATAVGAASCAIVAHLTTRSDFLQLVAAGSVGLLTYIVIVLRSEQRRRWSGNAFALITARRADELSR